MSLCYDFEKWITISLVSIWLTLTLGLISLAYGESANDFTFEAKVREFTYIITDYALDVTRFEIQGESDKQICLSGQCTIELEGAGNFDAPTPDTRSISYSVEFKVIDNHTNDNVGPKKKEYLEKFSARTFCFINDIIEDNDQEIYTCDRGSTTITRTFDSRSWDYYTVVMYDAKKKTVKAIGNFMIY